MSFHLVRRVAKAGRTRIAQLLPLTLIASLLAVVGLAVVAPPAKAANRVICAGEWLELIRFIGKAGARVIDVAGNATNVGISVGRSGWSDYAC